MLTRRTILASSILRHANAKAGFIEWTRSIRPALRSYATANHPRSKHVHALNEVTVDKELPDVIGPKRRQKAYFVAFCITMGLSLFGMIKYEDANSPIVSSTLQAIRRSPLCYDAMGANIRFCSTMPWITGSAGIAKPVVDFSYWAEGDKQPAQVHFRAERVPRENRYRTVLWSITPESGEKIDLINEEYHPFVPLKSSDDAGIRRNND